MSFQTALLFPFMFIADLLLLGFPEMRSSPGGNCCAANDVCCHGGCCSHGNVCCAVPSGQQLVRSFVGVQYALCMDGLALASCNRYCDGQAVASARLLFPQVTSRDGSLNCLNATTPRPLGATLPKDGLSHAGFEVPVDACGRCMQLSVSSEIIRRTGVEV